MTTRNCTRCGVPFIGCRESSDIVVGGAAMHVVRTWEACGCEKQPEENVAMSIADGVPGQTKEAQ